MSDQPSAEISTVETGEPPPEVADSSCRRFFAWSDCFGADSAFSLKSIGILVFELLLVLLTCQGTNQTWPLTFFVLSLVVLQFGNLFCLLSAIVTSLKFQQHRHRNVQVGKDCSCLPVRVCPKTFLLATICRELCLFLGGAFLCLHFHLGQSSAIFWLLCSVFLGATMLVAIGSWRTTRGWELEFCTGDFPLVPKPLGSWAPNFGPPTYEEVNLWPPSYKDVVRTHYICPSSMA